jgi:hypothetical protein
MSSEPRNAATEAFDAILPRWSDRDSVVADWHEWFADGFTREDRRRLIAAPPVDAAEYLDHHLTWFEMSAGQPSFEVQWIAVRGDRLGLSRVRVRFDDGFAAEMLSVGRCNPDATLIERMVLFDPDDVDAALAELDRLHSEILNS